MTLRNWINVLQKREVVVKVSWRLHSICLHPEHSDVDLSLWGPAGPSSHFQNRLKTSFCICVSATRSSYKQPPLHEPTSSSGVFSAFKEKQTPSELVEDGCFIHVLLRSKKSTLGSEVSQKIGGESLWKRDWFWLFMRFCFSASCCCRSSQRHGRNWQSPLSFVCSCSSIFN